MMPKATACDRFPVVLAIGIGLSPVVADYGGHELAALILYLLLAVSIRARVGG